MFFNLIFIIQGKFNYYKNQQIISSEIFVFNFSLLVISCIRKISKVTVDLIQYTIKLAEDKKTFFHFILSSINNN